MNNDNIKNRFDGKVDEVKIQVSRRPWVAIAISLVVGFITGAVIF